MFPTKVNICSDRSILSLDRDPGQSLVIRIIVIRIGYVSVDAFDARNHEVEPLGASRNLQETFPRTDYEKKHGILCSRKSSERESRRALHVERTRGDARSNVATRRPPMRYYYCYIIIIIIIIIILIILISIIASVVTTMSNTIINY